LSRLEANDIYLPSYSLTNITVSVLNRDYVFQEGRQVFKFAVTNMAEVAAEVLARNNLTGDDVIDFVKKKDSGDGCAIEEIISFFGEEADNVILTCA
jgi:3-oxoacyl-[acyl-carrier-protein] synthase III